MDDPAYGRWLRARCLALAPWLLALGWLVLGAMAATGRHAVHGDAALAIGIALIGGALAASALDRGVRTDARPLAVGLAIAVSIAALLAAGRVGRLTLAHGCASVPLALAIHAAACRPTRAGRRQLAIALAAMLVLVVRSDVWPGADVVQALDTLAAHDVAVRGVRGSTLALASLLAAIATWRAKSPARPAWLAAVALAAAASVHELCSFAVARSAVVDGARLPIDSIVSLAFLDGALEAALGGLAAIAVVAAVARSFGARARRARIELASVAVPFVVAVVTSAPRLWPHVLEPRWEDPGAQVPSAMVLPSMPVRAHSEPPHLTWVIDHRGRIVDAIGEPGYAGPIELVVDRRLAISGLVRALAARGGRRFSLRVATPGGASLATLELARWRFPLLDAAARAHAHLDVLAIARLDPRRPGPTCERPWRVVGTRCEDGYGNLRVGERTIGTVADLAFPTRTSIQIEVPDVVSGLPPVTRRPCQRLAIEPEPLGGTFALVASLAWLASLAIAVKDWRRAARGYETRALVRPLDLQLPIVPPFLAPTSCDRAIVSGGGSAYRDAPRRALARTTLDPVRVAQGALLDLARLALACHLAIVVAILAVVLGVIALA